MKSTDYNTASATYDNTRNVNISIIDIFMSRVSFVSGTKVLDFGCGTGNYLFELSKKFPSTFYGIEPSDRMREKAIQKNPSLSISEGDHETIPFPDNMFDFIYMTDVIHHINGIDKMFATLHLKMKEKRKLCIVTESHEQIESRWYNVYFPSLVKNEKERYPDISTIINSATKNRLLTETIDVFNHGTNNRITSEFIRMVEEKNYSMFRMLSDEEYNEGLKRLKHDINKEITGRNHGESIIWLIKE